MITQFKKLNQLQKMTDSVSVFVPATIGAEKVDNAPYVQYVAARMSEAFGGATAVQTQGFWMSERGELVAERTVEVYSYLKNLDNSDIDLIIELSEYLKVVMEQESVGLKINGVFYLV